MKKLLLASTLLCALPAAAQVQKGPINNVAGPTSASDFYKLVPEMFMRKMNEKVCRISSPCEAKIVSGNLTIDLSKGPNFIVSNSEAITSFNVIGTNPDTTLMNVFTVWFISLGQSFTQVWGGSIKLPYGNPPVLSATAGSINPLAFVSYDQASYTMFVGPTYTGVVP